MKRRFSMNVSRNTSTSLAKFLYLILIPKKEIKTTVLDKSFGEISVEINGKRTSVKVSSDCCLRAGNPVVLSCGTGILGGKYVQIL